MASTNPEMEKIFFQHILKNPANFEKVDPVFFDHNEIQLVYKVIRDEYLVSSKHEVPSKEQIVAMVKSNDPEGNVTNDILKRLLSAPDKLNYSDEWLAPRFNAWKLSKTSKDHVMKAIDYIRGMDETDFDKVSEVSMRIQKMFSDINVVNDTGLDNLFDFDDPDAHMVTESTKKISTGWTCVDQILDGGWDQASLVVLIGETNVGKSMWMQNISSKIVDQGANVLYVTLEMGAQKCMKRMGAMRLKIDAKNYDEVARDQVLMKNRINSHRGSSSTNLFSDKPGKLFIAKFDTGTLSVTQLDNYISDIEKKKEIKINAVVVDYIAIMGIEKGEDFKNNLFLKGKHLAEGLRRIADKYNCCVVTATQTDKAVWGANDIDLKNMPESKAIAETADTVFAIIRNPEMKKNNVYRLKILKKRDGEHKGEQIMFKFNTNYLVMEDDQFVGVA